MAALGRGGAGTARCTAHSRTKELVVGEGVAGAVKELEQSAVEKTTMRAWRKSRRSQRPDLARAPATGSC